MLILKALNVAVKISFKVEVTGNVPAVFSPAFLGPETVAEPEIYFVY